MKLMNTGSVLEMQLCSPRFGMDILSQWQVSLVERPDLAISEPISPLGIVWQVNLPRNPYTARRMLSQHRRYQYTALQALPRAEQRLELYTSQIEQNDPGESEHYDLDENEWPEPERVLHTWLVTAQQEASFTVVDNLREAGQQIVNLYQMLARLGRGNDWVNTNHAGHAIGRSRISWLGDIDTFLVRGMPPELVVLHQQHLHTCLEARLLWMRIGLMTTAFAVRLASSAAIPMNLITAAKPILRFIKQVLDEYKRLSRTIPDNLG
jgi:hypothetical protein